MNTSVSVQIHICDFNIIYEEYTYNDPIITQKWGYPHLCEHRGVCNIYMQTIHKYHANIMQIGEYLHLCENKSLYFTFIE